MHFPKLAYRSLLLLTAMAAPAWPGPIVNYSVAAAPAPPGFFRYDLTVFNPAANPQTFITGLIVSSAFSTFQVDASSTIGAPTVGGARWMFIPPAPPFQDSLTFFSPAAANDIGPGRQGGFRFDSPVGPNDFCPCDFEILLIERTQGVLPAITATAVPEPAGFTLAALSLLVLASRQRSQTRSPGMKAARLC